MTEDSLLSSYELLDCKPVKSYPRLVVKLPSVLVCNKRWGAMDWAYQGSWPASQSGLHMREQPANQGYTWGRDYENLPVDSSHQKQNKNIIHLASEEVYTSVSCVTEVQYNKKYIYIYICVYVKVY